MGGRSVSRWVGWSVVWLVGWLARLVGQFVCLLISIKNEVPVTCNIMVERITINKNFVGRNIVQRDHMEERYYATC